jgi:undecaprenyl pyrophosphate synthase
MDKLSSATESARPHALFILPPLADPRLRGLTLLVLADGNRRCSTGGGYAGGARRVVSIAEHLADRPDVEVMIACILSPDNVAKREDRCFFEIYKEFVALGVAISTRRVLVDAGVRIEICGHLASLRARGGHAVALADAIEAVAGMTAQVGDPALRLVLGVGYGRDVVRQLDVDVVLRTGMEEPGVLRLSGLRTSAGVVHCAIPTLWPDVEPRDVDEAIDLCRQHAEPRLTGGHDLAVIVELAGALSAAAIDAKLRATIPTRATPAAVTAALDRLFDGPLCGCATLAVEHVVDDGVAPQRYGSWESAPHVLRVVSGPPLGWPTGEGVPASVLAPGQKPPRFVLPDWLPLEYANVHTCETTAQGMVEGIGAAQRFSVVHPPLLGRDRTEMRTPRGVPEVVAARQGASERDALADRFVEKSLAWTEAAGLQLPSAVWRRAASNYARTAFFMHFRIPTEWDEGGAFWEERADISARYMLLVAAGDEGVFDAVFAGETPAQRWARLEISSRFLQGALRRPEERPRLPRVPTAALMGAIAEHWRLIFDRHRRACLPAAATSFRTGLASLYAASLTEHRAGLTSGLFTGHGAERAEREVVLVAIEEHLAKAPPVVLTRARALVGGAVTGDREAANELRALLYLAETSSAVGAGLLFRTAALAAPAPYVTDRSIALLDATAALLDFHFRLSNDLSGFLDTPGGDRDPKANACTLLVEGSRSGVARASTTIQAVATCRRLAAWLDGEARAAIERVATAWPSMGTILRRGTFIGRRVYEVGHYTTASPARMRQIFDEAEDAMSGIGPTVAPDEERGDPTGLGGAGPVA